MLEREASLVEIDLLRGGERVTPNPVVAAFLDRLDPAPDYFVLVSSAWRRTEPGWGYHVFPIGLRERLPCIGVPLTREEAEVALDLQFVCFQPGLRRRSLSSRRGRLPQTPRPPFIRGGRRPGRVVGAER